MSHVLYMHIGMLVSESSEGRGRDHVERQVVREPELAVIASAGADRLHMVMAGIHPGILLRRHLLFRNQLEMCVALVFCIGIQIHLITYSERIDINSRMFHRRTLYMIERVGKEGQHGMIEDYRIEAFQVGTLFKFDRNGIKHMHRIFAAANIIVARLANVKVCPTNVLRIFRERRCTAHISEFYDWAVVLQPAPRTVS
ncbi:hypothetical protein TFUB20_00209 [Tannerella forsythia]|uniref:Uncharacterized protein n=1 Tax=Tannerella forsythia TaxID=28112 RepID=A0A1D3UCZ4_TANFO|nr:hypothetical protein TFUB20_00209 [Tannerella forsythia]